VTPPEEMGAFTAFCTAGVSARLTFTVRLLPSPSVLNSVFSAELPVLRPLTTLVIVDCSCAVCASIGASAVATEAPRPASCGEVKFNVPVAAL